MTIGNRIAELRKSSGYSQEYVAEKLGISRQAVSKWEMDQSSPDTNNLIALAELFGVSVEYIATGRKVEVVKEPQEHLTVIREIHSEPRSSISVQKILGFIFLGTGLLALILGILLEYFLLIPSAVLLVAGIIFLAVKRFAGLWLSWTYLVVLFFGMSILSRINLWRVFEYLMYALKYILTAGFSGEITMNAIVSMLLLIWIGVNVTVTAIVLSKRNRELLAEKKKNKTENN